VINEKKDTEMIRNARIIFCILTQLPGDVLVMNLPHLNVHTGNDFRMGTPLHMEKVRYRILQRLISPSV
jgi:hypothetical protein